jgi:hypothetical protein
VEAAKAAAQQVAARIAARHAAPPPAPSSGKRRFSEVAGAPLPEEAPRSVVPRLQSELDPSNAGRGVVPVPDLQLYGAEVRNKESRDTLDDARDGRIEGGTWEHRKRAREMAATAEKAAMVTQMRAAGRGGGTHIGSYLPKEKLEAFLAKCRSVVAGQGAGTTEGAAAKEALEQYAANTLTSDNLGFQMLKGLGWTEGAGASRPHLLSHCPAAHGRLACGVLRRALGCGQGSARGRLGSRRRWASGARMARWAWGWRTRGR